MPVIKVWCLPAQNEVQLRELHQTIVTAVVSVSELKLKDENDMTCLFPPDQMQYGLGSEVIVEVTGLFAKRNRTPQIKKRLMPPSRWTRVRSTSAACAMIRRRGGSGSCLITNPRDGFRSCESEMAPLRPGRLRATGDSRKLPAP